MRHFLSLCLLAFTVQLTAANPPAKTKVYAVIELKKSCTPQEEQQLTAALKTFAKQQSSKKKRVKTVSLKDADKTRRYLTVRRFENKAAAKAYLQDFRKRLDKTQRKRLKKGFAVEKKQYRAGKKQRKLHK